MSIFLKNIYRRLAETIKAWAEDRDGVSVLDLGCGRRGNYAGFRLAHYEGIDTDHLPRRPAGRNEHYHRMSAEELVFPAKRFNFIISTSFFHHLDDKQTAAVIREMRRVLKPGGMAVVIDGVYPESRYNLLGRLLRRLDRGRYVRSKEDLRKVFAADFRIKKEYYFTEKIFAYSILVMEL